MVLGMTDAEERDVALFRSLCQFMWVQGEPLALVYDPTHDIYVDQGITWTGLDSLRKAGLILVEPVGFVKRKFGKHTRLFYFGKHTKIQFPKEMGNELDIGHVALTEKGKALVSASNAAPNQDFYRYVIEHWSRQGLITSSIVPKR